MRPSARPGIPGVPGAVWRWLRFNAVGALGMALQLSVLAVLNRVAPGRYLLCSAVAVECALLHNFVWHVRYTWRGRIPATGRALWAVLWRFHAANGLVSIAGNAVLMHLMVSGAHLPVVFANGLAILGCSGANFWLGERWAFQQITPGERKGACTFRREVFPLQDASLQTGTANEST